MYDFKLNPLTVIIRWYYIRWSKEAVAEYEELNYNSNALEKNINLEKNPEYQETLRNLRLILANTHADAGKN